MAKSADAFRTISEVAEWLGVQTHVLRFWESKFSQVKPVKRAGGRRYYRPADMLLLGGIRKLLHEDGLTIKGVQKVLREEGMAFVSDMSPPLDAETDAQLNADLTARMDEDVEQPPIEAEIVPFKASPQQPSDDADTDVAAPEAVEEPEPVGQSLPSFMRAPTPPSEATGAPEEEPTSGLPFPPLEEDALAPQGASAGATMAQEEAEGAPEERAAPEEETADATDGDAAAESDPPTGLPSFLSDYAAAPAEVASPAPTPRIVDAPDEPDPERLKVAPSALSKAAAVTHLTDAQRDMIRPLLAQLTTLRDQMASNRRDPR
ncbi:MAG: MerR family transcriptional regulator [Pseudomonadota bacterium]